LICLIVGVIPGMTVGPYLHAAVVAVLGDQTPQYSLAVWHGFSTPLLMSVIALVAGVLLYLSLRRYLARGEDGPPLFRELRGQRIFERILVTLSWRWARWLESHLGTRRLQPQLRLVVAIAFLAGLWPLFSAGFRPGAPSLEGVDPV